MSSEKCMTKESQFVLRKSISVQHRIIADDESSETVAYMARCAKKVLVTNYNYQVFHQMIGEILNSKEEVDTLIPSFLCGMEDDDKEHMKRRELMVDKLIDQLLKFLAMKVLLCDNVSSNNDCYDERYEDCQSSYRLNPSMTIREAWKAILILPLTYQHVCQAYGSELIDYDDDDEGDFLGEQSKTAWGRECYKWTIETYKSLYIVPPPEIFWPKLNKR
jgi:hypothetical protein